jgi:hypothetical protein
MTQTRRHIEAGEAAGPRVPPLSVSATLLTDIKRERRKTAQTNAVFHFSKYIHSSRPRFS